MSVGSEMKVIILILIGISMLTGLDLSNDMGEGVTSKHALIEVTIIAISLSGIFFFVRKLRQEKRRLNTTLDQAREDLRYWKQKSASFVNGLSSEIERQFDQWSLTKSEKDIALLLIKGFSTKEIAVYRSTAEKTVRVQTSSIYKKSKVANRSELTAFFLEDLLLPND